MTKVDNTSGALEQMHALDVEVGERSAGVYAESGWGYPACFRHMPAQPCQEYFDV